MQQPNMERAQIHIAPLQLPGAVAEGIPGQIALPATAPTRFTREGLMRALVRGDLHGRWDAVVQNQPDLLLEVIHQIGQRADLWPRVLVKLPDTQLHDITHLVAPVAASLLRPLLASRAFYEAAGGDTTHGGQEEWVQTVRLAAFAILFDADARTTDARYFAHVLLGKLGGVSRERYVQLAKAWSESLHVAGAARSLVAAVAGLGKESAAPVIAGAYLPAASAPRDLFEALVASLADARRDAGAAGLADALDIATARNSTQLRQQLQKVRSGAIALGGERFSVLQLQNLITALLGDDEHETGAAVVSRRTPAGQQTHTGPGPFRAAMLQEIAASATQAADEQRYLALVLDQLVHGRVLDLESIIAATASAGVTGQPDVSAPGKILGSANNQADAGSAAQQAEKIAGRSGDGFNATPGPLTPAAAAAAATAVSIAAESSSTGKASVLDAMTLRSAIASALANDSDVAILALAQQQGRIAGTAFLADVAAMFGLVSALVRADRVGGGVDRNAMLDAIVTHAKRTGATVAYFRHILDDLVQGRLLDLDAVAARAASSTGARRPAEAGTAPLVEATVARPDLYQLLLDALGNAVRTQGAAALAIELDRATSTAAPRLRQLLRQVREGAVALGTDRFTTLQLKNLIKVQIESGELPQGAQSSAEAFRVSMLQAIEQHAALVADQHRYHKLVLEQLVHGRLLDLAAITARMNISPPSEVPAPAALTPAVPMSTTTSGSAVLPTATVAAKGKPVPAVPTETVASKVAAKNPAEPILAPLVMAQLSGAQLRAEIASAFASGSESSMAKLASALPPLADADFANAMPADAVTLYRLVEAYVVAGQAKAAKRRNVMLDEVREKTRSSKRADIVLKLILADVIAGLAVDLDAALAAGEAAAPANARSTPSAKAGALYAANVESPVADAAPAVKAKTGTACDEQGTASVGQVDWNPNGIARRSKGCRAFIGIWHWCGIDQGRCAGRQSRRT
jgi:hypothetical protein